MEIKKFSSLDQKKNPLLPLRMATNNKDSREQPNVNVLKIVSSLHSLQKRINLNHLTELDKVIEQLAEKGEITEKEKQDIERQLSHS